MIKGLKKFFSLYTSDFWIFIVFIAALTGFIYYSGVKTGVKERQGGESRKLSQALESMTTALDMQAAIFQVFLDDGAYNQEEVIRQTGKIIDNLEKYDTGLEPSFFYKSFNDQTPPLFFGKGLEKLDGSVSLEERVIIEIYEKAMGIRGPFWLDIQTENGAAAYISPLYINGLPRAVVGICVDGKKISPGASFGTYITLFAMTAVLCVFLSQTSKKLNTSLMAWFSRKTGGKFAVGLSQVQLNNYQANIIILTSLTVVFVAYTVFQLISGQTALVLGILVTTTAIIIGALYVNIKRGLTKNNKRWLIAFAMLLPPAYNIVAHGFDHGNLPVAYTWIITVVTFSILLLSRQDSRLFFKLFICLLFGGLFCEVYLRPDTDIKIATEFLTNILYAGFVIFASLEFYTFHSLENYEALEAINKELRETQAQLIQRENMFTLGQLIAGIAHEINTPIGAIKASSEVLETLDMGKIIKSISRYGVEDLNTLIVILGICKASAKNMRSTIELRRGRSQVRKYLESIDVPNAAEISSLLSSMDICDVEKIANNMDIFRRNNIGEILRSARMLTPFTNGVQNIRFASDKVMKIVFALKSFSHMNITGEEREFDVIKNIDNVLVLYENQLKRGIEIIKRYDDYLPPIFGNVEEISQVWTNLAQNAIYAMDNVGKLTISVKNIKDKQVEISFTDTGSGIPPENLNKIFAPFFTTKPLGEGSGIGLDVCRKIVTKHSGNISVSSKPGRGATFTVTLPVKKENERGSFAETGVRHE